MGQREGLTSYAMVFAPPVPRIVKFADEAFDTVVVRVAVTLPLLALVFSAAIMGENPSFLVLD